MCHEYTLGIFTLRKSSLIFSQWAQFVAQTVKNLSACRRTQVPFLAQEDPREKGMATHSSILAWRIPCTKEPGGLQSMRSQRVGHDWQLTLPAPTVFILWWPQPTEQGKLFPHFLCLMVLLLTETYPRTMLRHWFQPLQCIRTTWGDFKYKCQPNPSPRWFNWPK